MSKKITFVRATLHNSTEAIPRAIEATNNCFDEIEILCWDRLNRGLPKNEITDGIRIRRFRISAPPRSLIMFFITIIYQFWVLWRIMVGRPTFVQVLDLESALPVVFASIITRSKIIYDMRDPIALSYSFNHRIQKLVYFLDAVAMSQASAFVLPSHERVQYLGQYAENKMLLIFPNTCHDDLGCLDSINAREKFNIDQTVVLVAYLGYLSDTRGARELLTLAKTFPQDVHIVVAGKVRSKDLYDKLRNSKGVTFLGLLSRLETLHLMRDSDIVSLMYDPSVPVNKMAAPNKYYEALMVGTPVLVSAGMSLEKEVLENRLGFVVDYKSSSNLRRVIDEIKNNSNKNEFSYSCRKFFLKNYQLNAKLGMYHDFYTKLTSM